MRKTKKEIIKHLREVSYTKKSALKIAGFLFGQGYTSLGEKIDYKTPSVGEKSLTFRDFIEWVEDNRAFRATLDSLIHDLEDARNDAKCEGDMETYERISKQLILLVENFEREFPSYRNLSAILPTFSAPTATLDSGNIKG